LENDPLSFLPHGLLFRFVDRVLEIVPGEKIVTLKNVTANDPHLQDHFPGNPIMPGVLIIEMMTQTAGLLLPKGSSAVLAQIKEARFRRHVVPGDQVVLSATRQGAMDNLYRFTTSATVGETLAAEAEITLAVQPLSR
jgi:3-hydroxyacyl-[acyl-carrier-protein] dehydratase